MRICLLPSDTWGVGSYRVLFPGRELEKRGHEVVSHLDRTQLARWDPAGGNIPLVNVYDFDRETARPSRLFDADSYVFQRRMERISPAAIRQLRRCGKHVVGELDDNYDDLPVSSPGWKVLRKHPDKLSVDWLNEGLRFCNLVTVSTPALQEHYSRYNGNVQVLPNFLDWDMWRDVTPQYEVERPKVRVGWMGWLRWRGDDLERLRSWIGPWLQQHPNVEFVSVGELGGNRKSRREAGHVSVHDYLRIPRAQRVTVRGAPFQRLPEITATIDIGLVPLEPSEFNECKSYLKGLEYAACGIPCVASPSQQYREFVREGVDGFLAANPGDWVGRLDELVGDDDLRRQMGRAALEKARSLTIGRHWRLWEQAWMPSASTSVQAPTGSPDGSTSTTALMTTSGVSS